MSTLLKDSLTRKKVLKSNTTKLKDKITNSINDADHSEILLFEDKIKKLVNNCNDIFQDICSQCDEKDFDTYVEEQQTVQDTLDELWLIVNRKNSKQHVSESVSVNETSSNLKLQIPDVKLPKLYLPTFNGTVEEWLSFYDLFNASVDNNSSLSNCQKLQYLKSACKGNALKIIQSLPISDDNYETAIELLKERFSNKRELTNALIKKLINIPSISSDSAQSILQVVDIINECVRSLNVLNQDVSGFSEVLIVYLIAEKLDKNTRCWWERTLKKEELGTLENLITFLKDHARTLQNSKIQPEKPKKVPYLKFNSFVAGNNVCVYCKEKDPHALFRCSKFLNLSVQKRIEAVKKFRFCFNCLSTDRHCAKTCKSKYKCRLCQKAHHTVLHIEDGSKPLDETENAESSVSLSPSAPVFHPRSEGEENQVACASTFDFMPSNELKKNKQTLLCTAMINVYDYLGNAINCRCLLDSGSEASFISENCANKLGLQRKRAKVQISCLGSHNDVTNGEVELVFSPHFCSDLEFRTSAFVIKKITSDVPNVSLPSDIVNNFNDLVLADPLFFEKRRIDLLLGVNVFFTLLKGDIIKRGKSLPFAVCSKLGWIISGTTFLDNTYQSTYSVNNIQLSTNELVERFWALDSVPEVKKMSKLDQECESHFQNTHTRDTDGRYVVKLPFKESPLKLGNSKELALQRFTALELRLTNTPETYKLYRQFMREYIDLGHMELINDAEPQCNSYYIPHHPVLKDSSTTTKLRVVFNASAKSSSGVSLNDVLFVGPRIQQELFEILVRFRTYPIAICADIEKMFRQIRVHQEDVDYQRILWRETVSEPIREYRLLTVTYGTSPAPFLATRSLLQLALDEQNDFPQASKILMSDFYVDDLLTGSASKISAKKLVQEMDNLMQRGGFKLRKWLSNAPEILDDLSPELREDAQQVDLLKDQPRKVLGINWHPFSDTFDFKVSPSNIYVVTKRTVLSEVAKLFDPFGWLAPSVIFAKIFLQELWTYKVDWDDPLDSKRSEIWRTFHEQLILLHNLKIPRVVTLINFDKIELHAFCDSSEKAYCTSIYVRSISMEEIKVSLLCAKTRVAPLKMQSLPRLELCSALLLANLLKTVMKCLNVSATNCFAWSDSTITLHWIASESRKWLPFVANRVSKIQDAIPNVRWNHVQGKNNPSDLATRGLQPDELIQCEVWFNGPEWLRNYSESVVDEQIAVCPDDPEIFKEEKKTIVSNFVKIEETSFLCKYSSWFKLCRIIAYCLRFIKNCKTPDQRLSGFLVSEELNTATYTVVRLLQLSEFPEEMQSLKNGKPLKLNSRILPLSPFLDKLGLLRVGGRLKNSEVSEDQKHPMLIPQKHFITKLIIRHYHEYYLHAAPNLLLAIIRHKFWIIAARSEIRKLVKNCIVCCRHRAQVAKQMMADLPKSRVTISRAFLRVGLDFAGPFMITHRSGRGQKSFKAYVCIFVCFTTHAVHFEVVEDLSARACLEAIKRFIARRGKPQEIFSDCGTNFKGVSKDIRNSFLMCQKNEQLQSFLSVENVKWSFIPPAAPHFGGLWESGIRSMKYHLRRSLGAAILTYPEFTTLITQIEACMNSRPLCPQSDDPTDFTALTPGHFLIGTALTALPERNLLEQTVNILDRFKVRLFVFQNFWKRWSREFLCQLQQRVKWTKPQENLSVNDLVLIKEDNIPPLQWKLGRIIRVYPGTDNKVRVVDVRTSHGEVKRPIVKLCPLPIRH